MADLDPTHLFDRFVDLVMHEDRNVHAWLGGTLVVEFLLAVCALVVLGWSDQIDGWTVTGLVLLSVLGAVLAMVGTTGADRHVERQRMFATSAAALQSDDTPSLFGASHQDYSARLSRLIRRARWVVLLVWLAFAAALVIGWYTQPPADDDGGAARVSWPSRV